MENAIENDLEFIERLKDHINARMNDLFQSFCEYYDVDPSSDLAKKAHKIIETAAHREFNHEIMLKTELETLIKKSAH